HPMMRAEHLERLLGAVARGGKAVGAEADPGQEGDERDPVEDLGILEVARRAEKQDLQLIEHDGDRGGMAFLWKCLTLPPDYSTSFQSLTGKARSQAFLFKAGRCLGGSLSGRPGSAACYPRCSR